MRRRIQVVLVCTALVGLAACGGGGSKVATATTTKASAGAPSSTTVAAAELPQFASNFDRVCTTQVGFPGATSYEPGPGPHPTVFFEEYRNKDYVTSSRSLPQGWLVKEDTNFKDNSELKPVQLIACSDQVKQTPTGKQCEFDDKGTKVKLELVDATYDLTVYAATTAKQIQKTTIEAKSTDCPYIATFEKGDTTYVVEPTDDQYINALKPVIAP